MVKITQKTIEITRSFSHKLNLGNYQTADFFASAKSEVLEKDAEKTSESLYEFVKNECIKSANRYLKELGKQPEVFNLKKEIIDELKKWFLAGGDKKDSDYGKTDKQEKYDEQSKLETINVEVAEVSEK